MPPSMPHSIVTVLQLTAHALEAASGSPEDAISFLSGAIATIIHKTLPPEQIASVADTIREALLDKRGCVPGVEFLAYKL